MGKTVVVFSCAHVDPSVDNERFNWLGEFLYDLKPDYVVDLGDGADMRSLNTFDTRSQKQSLARTTRLTSISIMMHKNVYDGSSGIINVSVLTTSDLRGTMSNVSKEQSKQTQDLREVSTGFPSGIFKQSTGSTNTMNTNTVRLQSLITMVSLTRTSLVAATWVLLCLVCTMLTGYLLIGTTAALVATVINVILSLRMRLTLTELSVLLLDVIKVQQKAGLDKPTKSGGQE